MSHSSAKFCSLLPILWFLFGIQNSYCQCSSGYINVQGRVLDASGNPVHKANLDFFPNGFPDFKVPANPPGSDKTSSLGYYNTCLYPPDFYRLTINPLYPYSTHLVARELLNVDLHTATILPDIRLEYGTADSGWAKDTLGKPVDSLKLSADNLSTQQRIYLSPPFTSAISPDLNTPGNRTDSLGFYRIVMPSGMYRLRFAPAVGRRQLGVQVDSFKIASRDTFLNVIIHSGLFVSGQIVDSTNNPKVDSIPDVAFGLEDTLGKKIFLPHNKSDSSGKFTVVAPPGVFDFLFIPPRDSHFVARRERAMALSTDTAFVISLNRGALLTVNVRDSLGQPVPFANLDVNRLFPTPKKIFTPTDNSDAAGTIKVAVPPDSYSIVVKPPSSRPNLDTLFLPGLVKVFHDTVLNVTLPGEAISIGGPGTAHILDVRPNPFRPGNGQKMKFPINMDSLSGNWDVSLTIFSVSGEIVFRDKELWAGGSGQTLYWDGHNPDGRLVASGIYFCKIRMQEIGHSSAEEKVLKVAVIR